MSELVKQTETAIAKQDPVTSLIEGMKGQIARAVPKHIGAERLARVMLTEMRKNPVLADCMGTQDGRASLLGALMLSAQLGLEPGPLGHSYLVPFGGKVQFIIGYRGLLDLARRSGNVKRVSAEIVYKHDKFSRELGMERNLVHVPAEGERGDMIGVQATYELTNGGRDFVYLTKDEVEKFRAKSKARNNGPWQTDYEAMAKKTALRRLANLMPMSAEVMTQVMTDETVAELSPAYENAIQTGQIDIVQMAQRVEDAEDAEIVEP